jgi:hypothetical protein
MRKTYRAHALPTHKSKGVEDVSNQQEGPRKSRLSKEEKQRRLNAYIQLWNARLREDARRRAEAKRQKAERKQKPAELKPLPPRRSQPAPRVREPRRSKMECKVVGHHLVEIVELCCPHESCASARLKKGIPKPSSRFHVTRANNVTTDLRLVCASCDREVAIVSARLLYVRVQQPQPQSSPETRRPLAQRNVPAAVSWSIADWWRDQGDPPPGAGTWV